MMLTVGIARVGFPAGAADRRGLTEQECIEAAAAASISTDRQRISAAYERASFPLIGEFARTGAS